VDRSRVLEIGTLDGWHLLPLACLFPGSHFTGIDLTPEPIALAQQAARELALSNIRFQAMNLTDITAEFGEFDYIIAHGLYSWVPRDVRLRLMQVLRANLAPGGLAYVSLNTYPGGHALDAIREMLIMHCGQIEGRAEKVGQTRAFLHMLADSRPAGDSFRGEIEGVLSKRGTALLFDELAEINEPTYLVAFVDHAARHGLRYVGDTEWLDFLGSQYPEPVASRLKELQAADFLRSAQYLDFVKLTRFRRAVLCRDAVNPSYAGDLERVAGLRVGAWVEGDASTGEFRNWNGAKITIHHPLMRRVLADLGRLWPGMIPLGDILAEAGDEKRTLCELCFYLASYSLLHLRGVSLPAAREPGSRPHGFEAARWQVSRGGREVTNLLHMTVEIPGEIAGRVLLAADGTRDTAALLNALPGLGEDDLRTTLSALAMLGLLRK
jgi:SAM-dependent methyltransferase